MGRPINRTNRNLLPRVGWQGELPRDCLISTFASFHFNGSETGGSAKGSANRGKD